ncbi:ATP-binding protein [Rhodococcus triatomae]|uniref:ATPase family associated with various cellular activities (AAA) n=1 Tax=Rhodococcus triatomae TaxID=300028 RepID=A0A1G8J183_9NOCA|nr:ATP-binding protein [Rhodococcus triatomae]QNG19848.1 ATP-binding protein [Rhodococcus triatomae]QNG24236.1 ATP-binding protein [Rhodococcus triatomae]SDI24812.1 ATPase family associated with various cellular activities (AAA) [Rhodococcus triatomae]
MTTDFVQSLEEHLASEPDTVRRAIEVIGQILTGAGGRRDTAESFVSRSLAAPLHELATHEVDLTATTELTVGAVLADLIESHRPLTGPGELDDPPSWRKLELGGSAVSIPTSISAAFPAGSLAPVDLVVRVSESYQHDRSVLRVYARADDRRHAAAVADTITRRADTERNFLRGRVLLASCGSVLRLELGSLCEVDRCGLVLPDEVWRELDTNIAAVTSRAELMRSLGLGTRRGILLAGPPGVGKSAVTRTIAAELLGAFTVIVVDADAGASRLREIYRETRKLGPTVVILDDIDLYIGNRSRGSGGPSLAGLLAVLDGVEKYDDVLTLATTNDPGALDSAATRASRFDSVVHLGYPGRESAVRILEVFTRPLGVEIDCGAVLEGLDGDVSGADLRDMVSRAVLEHGSELTTASFREVVRAGRWKVAELTGQYL